MTTDKSRLLQQGVLPALWIPTDIQGQFMESEFTRLMQFSHQSGVSGFMVLGTTGEFPHLEIATRKRVLEVAVANAAGLPVMANISDIRPRVVADLGRFARSVGVDAVSLLPPYYYPLAQEDLQEFFVRSAEEAGLPLFLYNFPERVGYKISLETIAAVADRVPMLGIKQSGAEFSYHQELVDLGRKKNFVVITGADTAIPEALPLGVTGVVSGLSNGLADLVVNTYRQVKSGVTRENIPSAAHLSHVSQLLGKMEFPFNIAATIAARGLPIGHPKMIVSSTTQARFQQLTGEFRRLYQEWNLI